jgi:hypothetical protein
MTRHAIAGPALALAGVLIASACGGESSPGADREVLRGPDPSRRAVTPARFVSDVTFVPFDAPAGGLHVRFRHLTSAETLVRDYGAWRLEDDAWRTILRIRDTLPVPRAGWRVLPGPGLGVVVGEGGELDALIRKDSADGFRLELGEAPAEWSSPTGQRERLRRAVLIAGGSRRTGLAVVRRQAQERDVPRSRGLYGFLLVADSGGGGLVIRRHGGTPPGRRPPAVDTAAVGHALLDGEARSWPGIRLARAGGGADSPPASGWSLEVPGAGVEGRLRPGTRVEVGADGTGGDVGEGGSPDTLAADDGGGGEGRGAARPDPVRLYSVTGTLRVLGRARPVRGLGVETGKP